MPKCHAVHFASKSFPPILSADITAACAAEWFVGILGQLARAMLRSAFRPVSIFALENAADQKAKSTENTESIGIDIRMCKECKHTLFSKRDLNAELAHTPPDIRAYGNLVQFEHGIRTLLPKFQRLLGALQ